MKETHGVPALWNLNAAAMWSLWLTPIFGSSLAWMNGRSLRSVSLERSAKIWLCISTLAFLLIPAAVAVGMFDPNDGFALYVLVMVVWYFDLMRPNHLEIVAACGESFRRRPMWGAIVVGLPLALVVSLAGQMAFLTASQWARAPLSSLPGQGGRAENAVEMAGKRVAPPDSRSAGASPVVDVAEVPRQAPAPARPSAPAAAPRPPPQPEPPRCVIRPVMTDAEIEICRRSG